MPIVPPIKNFPAFYGTRKYITVILWKGYISHRLSLFENRVLRRIFGPKRDEVTGDWRNLRNEELHNLYSSAYIIRMLKSRRMRWAGDVARMRETRNAYRILVGKREGSRPLEKPRRRWEKEVGEGSGRRKWEKEV
jgi:hypothetical protein